MFLIISFYFIISLFFFLKSINFVYSLSAIPQCSDVAPYSCSPQYRVCLCSDWEHWTTAQKLCLRGYSVCRQTPSGSPQMLMNKKKKCFFNKCYRLRTLTAQNTDKISSLINFIEFNSYHSIIFVL